MTTDEAVALAVTDAQHVVEVAKAANVRREGSELLVDGTQYSPAWRVLAGGSAVHEASYDHDDDFAVTLIEAYEGTLDERIEAANLDLSITWREGMLFAFGPDFDHDAVNC